MTDRMKDKLATAEAIVVAHLANAGNKTSSEELPGLVEKVMLSLDRFEDALPAPAEAPVVAAAPLAALAGSTIRVLKPGKAASRHAERVWPGVPGEVTDKFEQVIERLGIQRDTRGRPICVRTLDRLISPDGMRVLDPIAGGYFSMLKHHLKMSYGLTHAELLLMYNLSAEQLPETAPKYSTTKSLAAKSMGLGKRAARA